MAHNRLQRVVGIWLRPTVLSIFLIASVACGNRPARPPPTQAPQVTAARPPTAEPPPAPTPDVEQLFPGVSQLCAAAFFSTVREDAAEFPVLAVKGTATQPTGDSTAGISWHLMHLASLQDQTSVLPAEVRTLVCVKETFEQVGCYSESGGVVFDLAACVLAPPANRRHWDVRLVRVQDQQVIAATSLVGGDPPESITLPAGPATVYVPGTGGAAGSEPVEDLVQWIQQSSARAKPTLGSTLAPATPVALTFPGVVVALYCPFDGAASDMSGNHTQVNVDGATLTSDRFGVRDRAYYFDGVNDSILFDASAMPVGSFPRTISAWIKADSFPPPPESFPGLGSRATVIGWGRDDSLQLSEMQIVDNHLVFHNYNDDRVSAGRVELSKWYHLVIIYWQAGTQGRIGLYINGVGEQFDCGLLDTVKGVGRIGAFSDPTVSSALFPNGYDLSYFHGAIDDVAVFAAVLSDEQIMALYHEGGWE
jgi:hypothetical protein